ncbi:flagellar motor protein MotB [Roseovarius salinarum]|uniref:flagellar motor protein MotB n=1 Tax=Roseovarius salinarum TaxID=1981892 RepID=UPI000C34364D|nr:flagellar motor protein MotB [Roseovarius salinarum]
MGAHGNVAPVIIKKKKVVAADGHHGGAWKVAYADFVTAMMAFFLLMWLLNATTEKQRKGIADYFSPTIPIHRVSGGGDGDFSGESVFSEDVLARNGTGATSHQPTEDEKARGPSGTRDHAEKGPDGRALADKIRRVEERLMAQSGESLVSRELQRHILTRVTDEGLVIELFDLADARLFNEGTERPTKLLRQLSAIVVDAAGLVTNRVSVEAHTRARPIVIANNPVWPLSMKRAGTMRDLLRAGGLEPERIRRVTGHADREPAAKNRMAIRNNRLEIVLLRSDAR